MIPARNKILLVDDNELYLNILVQAFRKTDFDCIKACSAMEAIDLMKTELPDIILSDYEMPGMNGMQFRRYLMERKDLQDIPFVFLTSDTDAKKLEEGLGLNAIDYIIKNTPVSVIITKLNNLLLAVNKQRELSTIELRNAAKSLNIKSIPVKLPEVKGFEIDFWHRSYQDIPGGDFIDFIQVNERYNFIVLGDIMGKKWKAWYFTFGFLSYIRSAIRFAALNGEYSTASILQKVNQIICLDDVLQDVLSGLSLLLIDAQSGIITYSGAGDLPLLHYKHEKAQTVQVKSDGLLLGLFPDAEYNEQQIVLNNCDKLYVFTDGMTDYADASGNKSDYNQFANLISGFLVKGISFGKLKTDLFDMQTDNAIDDRSIIHIFKN